MKKRLILSSMLTLILCLSLIAGATYALFTSKTKNDITISSGKVEYISTIENLKTYSMDVEQKANNFENGGSAEIDGNSVSLNLITPGDKVTFEIKVINNSDIKTQYQIIMSQGADDGLFNGLKVVINNHSFKGTEFKTNWQALDAFVNPEKIQVSIELPVETESVYQNNNTKIFIAVYAVQGNADVYNEVVVDNQIDLNEAIANLIGPTRIYLPAGTFNLTSSMVNKDFIIVGDKTTVIDTTQDLGATNGAKIAFEGVTVKFGNDNYKGFTHAEKLTYKDCIIEGKQFLYAKDVKFINCILNNKADYSVWTYGASNVTFTNCTFNTGGKAILVYNEEVASSFVANVILNNCAFYSNGSAASDKAAVETGSNADNTATSNRYNLTFINCIAEGFNANNSSSMLWGNKNNMDNNHLNVIIDGVDKH